MFTVQLLSIICIISLVICSQTEDSKNEILVLNKNNINDTISENKHIFISFYASWCGFSSLAAPQYKEAAKKALELELPVTFAQIESEEITKAFDVDGYPTYKLYRRGVPLEYAGKRKTEDFTKWLQNNLGLVKTLNTIQEANELIAGKELVMFGFFKYNDSEKAQVFKNMSDHFYNDVIFAITSNEDIFQDYNVSDNSVLLYSKYSDEPLLTIEKLSLDNVQSAIEAELTPNLIEIDNNTIIEFSGLLKSQIKAAFILVSGEDAKTKPFLQITRILAKEYKYIHFLVVDVDKKYLEPLYSQFNITEFPSFVYLPNVQTIDQNYKITEYITLLRMKLLLSYLEEGSIDDLISEDYPKALDKTPVYTLIKSNFLKVTHDSEKSVLVYFYSDQSSNSNQSPWKNVIKKVGETFASEDDVIISEIQIGLNGIEDKWYDTVPSIALFRKDDNKQIFYKGKPEVGDVVKFVKYEGVNHKEE